MYAWYINLLVLHLCMQAPEIRGAKILAVLPIHSYSHQVNYRPILIELARRGHNVVVITTIPINDTTINNYTEINVGHLFPPMRDLDFLGMRYNKIWLQLSQILWDDSYVSCDKILDYDPVKKLYENKTKQKFDLLIVEFVWYYALFGLAHIFECPIVGVLSLGLFHTIDDIMGLPPMASYPSNWEMGNLTGEHLPFWRRMSNLIIRTYDVYKHAYFHLPKHDKMAKKYFGSNFPYIEKIIKNTSLVLMNHHEVIQYPKLLVGKIITLGGIYTSLNITVHVPPKLKRLMDEATEGFIFVSLGSNIQSKNLPPHIKQIFLEVFSNLSHKVIWKYEDDTLPSIPSNIYIAKWLPQRAILSHPNIKLFIYQGGLQSTEEAIVNGVPLVGLPVLADQDTVIARMVGNGIARSLEITALTKENFDEAIRCVLNNNSFKENAMKAKKVFHDRPYDTLQHAIWWIEYVIRHKGTPYHYYSITDDPWYSRYDEDVIAALAIALFIITCIIVIIFIKLILFGLGSIFEIPKASRRKLKRT